MLAHVGDLGRDPLAFHLHPDVLALVAAVAVAYWLALRFLAPPGQPRVSRRQASMLVAAIVGLLIASEWPLHDLSEGHLYSAHMVQHSLYSVVLPPLFILGTPAWLWRRILEPVLPAFRLLVHPAVAVAVFAAVTLLTHLPAFATAAVRSAPAHIAQHAALILSSVLVWWPLTSPLPDVGRLTSPVHRMVYPFFQFLVPSIAGSFLLWAREPVYKVYGEFPKLWGFTTLSDQQWGGVIMEVVEGGVMGGLMLAAVFKAARRGRDRPAQPIRNPTWAEVARVNSGSASNGWSGDST